MRHAMLQPRCLLRQVIPVWSSFAMAAANFSERGLVHCIVGIDSFAIGFLTFLSVDFGVGMEQMCADMTESSCLAL